jgi:hypothetical protein
VCVCVCRVSCASLSEDGWNVFRVDEFFRRSRKKKRICDFCWIDLHRSSVQFRVHPFQYPLPLPKPSMTQSPHPKFSRSGPHTHRLPFDRSDPSPSATRARRVGDLCFVLGPTKLCVCSSEFSHHSPTMIRYTTYTTACHGRCFPGLDVMVAKHAN